MQVAARRAEASVSSRSLQILFLLALLPLAVSQNSAATTTSAAPATSSTPSLWSINIDNAPAPPPADGPPASFNAIRDSSYLPATVIGIIGSYLITVIVVCLFLLLLARQLRRQRAQYQRLPTNEPSARLKMIGTRDNKDIHVDIKGIEEPPRTPFWKMGGRKNSVQEQDSGFEIKHVTFDNAVQATIDAERANAHAQQNEYEMSQLYAAVLRHENGLESQQTRKNSTTTNGYYQQAQANVVARPEHIYQQHSRRPSPPKNYDQQQVSSSGRPFVYPEELAHLRPSNETAPRPAPQRTNSAGLPSSPAPAANGISHHPYANPASPANHARSSSGASSPGRGSRRPTPLNLNNGPRQQSSAYMNDPKSPPIPRVPSAQAAAELERQRYTASPPRSDNSSRSSHAHSISQKMMMGANGVRGYDEAMYGDTVPLHNHDQQYQNGLNSQNDFSNRSSNTMVNNSRRPSNTQQAPPTPSWRDDPRSAHANFSKPLPPISRYAEEPTTPIDEEVPINYPGSARPHITTFAQARAPSQPNPQIRFDDSTLAPAPTFQRPKKGTPAPLNLSSNSNNPPSLSATQARDATLSSTGFASLPFRTQFGSSAPTTTTVPLASPGLPLRHPLSPTRPFDASTPMTATPMKSPGLKQTILNLKPKRTEAFVPNTAGLMVPNTAGIYSPYMPMTPMTPMTPSRLVGREERRKAEKERRKRDEPTLVVPEEDAWE